MTLLNEYVYRSLCKIYGRVGVTDKGDPGDYVVEENHKDGKVYRNYVVKEGGSYGERYRLDCPFCGDDRDRLYVSYLFGMEDPKTGFPNLGNLHCFNEECHKNWSNIHQLWQLIKAYSLVDTGEVIEEIEEANFGTETKELYAVPPGKLLKFSELIPGNRDYSALEYLRDARGFDVQSLEDYYGVRYLQRSFTYSGLNGRVWTPFYRNSQLAAWTARAVPGLCPSEVPHWHSKGGLGGLLYGLNSAVSGRVCVLVEGPADRWAVGSSSVAWLGKSVGGTKLGRFIQAVSWSSVELVVILLDPKQPENERVKGHTHPILVAKERCEKYLSVPVLPVFLPLLTDPGSLPGRFLSKYLSRSLSVNGYPELGEVLAGDVLRSSVAWRGSRDACQLVRDSLRPASESSAIPGASASGTADGISGQS